MTFRPQEPKVDWDKYGPWLFVIGGLLFVSFFLGGCTAIRAWNYTKPVKGAPKVYVE